MPADGKRRVLFDLPDWAAQLNRPSRYKVLYGGRGSAKTMTIAAMVLMQAMERPLRIVCVREIQDTIEQSVREALVEWIDLKDLHWFYTIRERHIIGSNGSLIFFRGMSETTQEQVKGWQHIDRVWFDEAHRMSKRSAELLRPTIRAPGSELWFTFNPASRADPVWQDFVISKPSNAIVLRVNYDQNPWFPAELEQERLDDLRQRPHRYEHIWLGQPDDEGMGQRLLPYALVEKCVDAHLKANVDLEALAGRVDAGLDVADGGGNMNALVLRRGPLVFSVEKWHAPTVGHSTRRAHRRCTEVSANRLFYDVGGVGAGVRSHLNETQRNYYAEPVQFGQVVSGPDTEMTYEVSNRDFFARRNSQLGWALKMRAQNTDLLLNGENVDPARCLFIDSRIQNLVEYLSQLAQPMYDENKSGRIEIEKTPEDNNESPDMYDATALAFAWDSRDGLRQRSR